MPARYDLSEYFTQNSYYGEGNILGIGNYSELNWEDGSLSFDHGSYSWNGLTYSEEKSTLSFTLVAGEPGRTTLRVYLPNFGSYYREVHVTDEQGNLVLAGDVPEGVYVHVREYSTHARFVNGRPWYPSAEAEDEGISYSLVVSNDDPPYEGYFGMTNGTTSEIHDMRIMWDDVAQNYTTYYYIDSGVRYNTADTADNSEHVSLSITEDDIENANIWWENPTSPVMGDSNTYVYLNAAIKVSADYFSSYESYIRSH